MEESDPDLMERLAKGDDLALNQIMDRWSTRVASFLFRLTGSHDAAVDLAQETFVKLYQAKTRYKATGNFSTYLFAIASNLAKNHARWKSRHPTVSLDTTHDDGAPNTREITDPCQTPEEAAETAEKIAAVNHAFQRLPPDLREAMTLFIYEGLSYADIGSISHCSPKAVETRIYRARQMLKDQLKHLIS